MRFGLRALTAALAAAALLPALAVPVAADDLFTGPSQFGLGFGSDLATLSPLDASSLMGDGLGFTDGTGLFSTFDAGQQYAEAYSLMADISTSSATAIESADVARQSQEAADAKRAQAAAQTQVSPDGCPVSVPAGTLRGGAESMGVYQLCANSVAQAASPAAAEAIKFAFRNLGAPYACGGAGRLDDFKFDCSSLVARAYHEGAGLNTAGDGWSPTTRDMVPWGGSSLASWASYVEPSQARPGDLVLYDTGGANYRHVVMLLSDGFMLHTNSCGDVAHVTTFWGYDSRFLVARRVVG